MLGSSDKILIDGDSGEGVVPYLPLNELSHLIRRYEAARPREAADARAASFRLLFFLIRRRRLRGVAIGVHRRRHPASRSSRGSASRSPSSTKPAPEEAGLHFKIPLVDTVVFFDKRNLNFDVPTEEIQVGRARTHRGRRVRALPDHTAFAVLSIRARRSRPGQSPRTDHGRLHSRCARRRTDPKRHRISSTPRGPHGARSSIIANAQQAEGRAADAEIDLTNDEDLGIEIIDVRIRRADLPEANAERVFTRMTTERRAGRVVDPSRR